MKIRYCGERGEGQCNACLAYAPDPPNPTASDAGNIREYRRTYAWVLRNARYVICPTYDVFLRLRRYEPSARFVVASHELLEGGACGLVEPKPCSEKEALRIAILGNVNGFKGAPMVAQVAGLASKKEALVEIRVVGVFDASGTGTVQIPQTGTYRPEELPSLLERVAPHLAWFPVSIPETFSYTLSECLQAGLPVAVPDIGCFPERIARRPWSWVRPWSSTAQEWLEFFSDLRERHFRPARPPEPAPAFAGFRADTHFYRERYLGLPIL